MAVQLIALFANSSRAYAASTSAADVNQAEHNNATLPQDTVLPMTVGAREAEKFLTHMKQIHERSQGAGGVACAPHHMAGYPLTCDQGFDLASWMVEVAGRQWKWEELNNGTDTGVYVVTTPRKF